MGVVHSRVEEHHGRRAERTSLRVDEFVGLDASVDAFIRFLQLSNGMESQYVQEIIQFTVAHGPWVRGRLTYSFPPQSTGGVLCSPPYC